MKVDFDRIKRTTDLVRVVESYGIRLRKVGKDHVGLCPFHDDHTPSLRVTAAKGLFRCPACGAAGNVIQFVARKEGIGEREAALKLLATVPGVKVASKVAAPPGQATPIPPPHPAALLQRVAAFYAKTLHKDTAGLDYLRRRKLADPALLASFQVGYCNGTLPKVLPQDGGELVDGLKALGVLNAQSRELFRGCVTVPILDEQGNVVGLYGRRVEPSDSNPSLHQSTTPAHLYLPGPHRGVFNHHGARHGKTVFIAEAILDAMSLWQAGFKNVIALYGAQGWTEDHERLLRESGTREAWLALDNDDAGRDGAVRLKEKLSALGVDCHAVPWPEGVKDANEFFQTRGPAEFEALLAQARPGANAGADAPRSETLAKLGEEQITPTAAGLLVQYGPRRYDVRAIERPSPARLRATVKAVSADPASLGRFHVDTVDFYLSRSRRPFILETARLFHETAEIVEADLNRLTELLEKQTSEPAPAPAGPVVSVEDQAEALKLGRAPDLADEIVRDLTRLGPVGEAVNKLMGYLVMTSRKMDDPLALLILSGSGAGKSLLQDAILKLCPEEDLVKLTSLTDRALFYKGEDSLKHKALAVEEVAGAEGAVYAIRNLISAKKLVIETTVKNPMTGQLTTQLNTVYGPTAVFQTTTRPDLDAETRSRFIVTSIDESPEQTRAILEAQRQSHTLEGLRRGRRHAAIIARHHAFQRLLKPVAVVNPFEPLLTYAEDRLAVRRDNPKYLQIILAVTFLHQLQREVKHDPESGLDYIETALGDIAIAHELATALLGRSLDDLSQPGRELLRLILDYVLDRAAKEQIPPGQVAFTRRELREALKWSEYQLRTYLAELERLEYLLPLAGRQGQPFRYRLLYDGQGQNGERFFAGLKSVEQLRQEAEAIGLLNGQNGEQAPPTSRPFSELRGQNEPLRGGNGNFEGTSLNSSPEVNPLPSKGVRNASATSSRFRENMYRKNGGARTERASSYVR